MGIGLAPPATDGVTGELLAPAAHEHLLGAGHLVAAGGEAGQARLDHAPVDGRTRWVRAAVPDGTGGAPARGRTPGQGVVRGERVHLRPGRELRVEGETQQPAVPEVVHLRPQEKPLGGTPPAAERVACVGAGATNDAAPTSVTANRRGRDAHRRP